MSELQNKIIEELNKKNLRCFSIGDVDNLANYKTVAKALETMTKEKKIKRIIQGIYAFNDFDPDLGIIPYSEGTLDFVMAIARRANWHLAPNGDYALFMLKLSDKCPLEVMFRTDGPSRTYVVKNLTISFMHRARKEVNYLPYPMLVAVQAILKIGKKNMNNENRKVIANYLNSYHLSIYDFSYNLVYWVYRELQIISRIH